MLVAHNLHHPPLCQQVLIVLPYNHVLPERLGHNLLHRHRTLDPPHVQRRPRRL